MMLIETRHFAQPPIRQNRHQRYAAAAVIGRQQAFPGLIDRNLRGPFAVRRHFVQKSQRAGPGIDGESAHRVVLAGHIFAFMLALGIQEFLAGMDREERRAGDLGRQREFRRLARGRIETEGIDALSVRACVGADIDEGLAIGGACDGCAKQEQEESGLCAGAMGV